MTRLDLLKLVIAQARANGFEFRKWYARHTARPWVSFDDAAQWLSLGRRCFTLLFSHEFASCFWKSGTQITFSMPAKDFSRVLPDGTVKTVHRKAFTRRTARPDVWKYHLREMAGETEPLRYLRRYVRVEEDLDPDPDDTPNGPAPSED
ncbi:hypothetical protein [Terriglobus saanensis]|uniref:hypothetical protein n=1 Tax=Terriglobus saanensis TaxID=870903 RepID=UPI000325B6FF|nr:hypothetical protein [Terriglobus saanensis]